MRRETDAESRSREAGARGIDPAALRLGGHLIDVGVSIGVALAPSDGSDADQILESADLALCRAKNEGRNTFRFYEAAMDGAGSSKPDPRQALTRGELELHYQPRSRRPEPARSGSAL